MKSANPRRACSLCTCITTAYNTNMHAWCVISCIWCHFSLQHGLAAPVCIVRVKADPLLIHHTITLERSSLRKIAIINPRRACAGEGYCTITSVYSNVSCRARSHFVELHGRLPRRLPGSNPLRSICATAFLHNPIQTLRQTCNRMECTRHGAQ